MNVITPIEPIELFFTNDHALLKVGGAISGDSLDLAKQFFNAKPLPGKRRSIIVISQLLHESLTLNELKAIYYHELGHIRLGHTTKKKHLLDLEKELQADAFAATHINASIVLSALMKLPNIIKTSDSLKTMDAKKLEVFLTAIDGRMQPRYKALQAMCL